MLQYLINSSQRQRVVVSLNWESTSIYSDKLSCKCCTKEVWKFMVFGNPKRLIGNQTSCFIGPIRMFHLIKIQNSYSQSSICWSSPVTTIKPLLYWFMDSLWSFSRCLNIKAVFNRFIRSSLKIDESLNRRRRQVEAQTVPSIFGNSNYSYSYWSW